MYGDLRNYESLYKKCDAPQKQVTYVGKMNSEFSTKFSSGHPYQHVPEEYKAYCSIEPEKRAYKVQSLKNVLLRKSHFKFLEDMKMKKIHISALPTPIWLKFGCETLKYTCTIPAKVHQNLLN